MTATTPVHRDAGHTEIAAAKRASKWADSLEARVLTVVVECGEAGLTALESLTALGMPLNKLYSVAPRLSAMKRKGWVESSGEVRELFGVYVATEAGRAKAATR